MLLEATEFPGPSKALVVKEMLQLLRADASLFCGTGVRGRTLQQHVLLCTPVAMQPGLHQV
jgi:hypothetical protein